MDHAEFNDSFVNGEKYTFISIDKIPLLKNELEDFKNREKLNNFQKWIVNDLYDFFVPHNSFAVSSILLIAIPHPLYTNVVLAYQGKKITCICLVMSDFDKTDKTLKESLSATNYHIAEAKNLPLKRLAVQSGLAVYGKNNITYVEGLGSSFSLNAYYTDIPSNNTKWVKVNIASICGDCSICFDNCPTKAIQKDRFLINNQVCLSALNETGKPFPDWLSKSVHHSLYDCIKCQISCPMNKNQFNNVGKTIEFNEAETNILLSGARYEDYPGQMKSKAKYLGLHQWPDGIAKNVKVLIENEIGRL